MFCVCVCVFVCVCVCVSPRFSFWFWCIGVRSAMTLESRWTGAVPAEEAAPGAFDFLFFLALLYFLPPLASCLCLCYFVR